MLDILEVLEEKNATSSYKHKLTSTEARFGTVTTCSSDDRLKDNEELIESACKTLSKPRPQTYDKNQVLKTMTLQLGLKKVD